MARHADESRHHYVTPGCHALNWGDSAVAAAALPRPLTVNSHVALVVYTQLKSSTSTTLLNSSLHNCKLELRYSRPSRRIIQAAFDSWHNRFSTSILWESISGVRNTCKHFIRSFMWLMHECNRVGGNSRNNARKPSGL